MPVKVSEELEKEICRIYVEEKIGCSLISKRLGTSESTVRRVVRRNGIEIRGRQLRFDNTIFDSIDTEEKAYWLGFIFADGWVANIKEEKRNFAFAINISKKDLDHLRKWNKFSGFRGDNIKFQEEKRDNGKVYEKCRWQISNEHFWNVLNSYGCHPNKTQSLDFPDESIFKDKSLIRHFIRGYWDGDGSVTHHADGRPKASVCGTEEFLTKLCNYLPERLRLYSTSTPFLFTVETTGPKAMKILHYLYDNSTVYMDRKKNLFLDYCRSYEKSYELLEGKNGEDCDVNTVLNSEIAQGSESV